MNDFVNRQDLLDGIEELKQSPWFKNGEDKQDIRHYGYLERKEAVEVVTDLCIKKEPSVTPKEKTGKWIKTQSGDDMFPEIIVCSKCNNENSHLDFNEHAEPIGKVFIKSKYCPNCGARMQEVNEDGM